MAIIKLNSKDKSALKLLVSLTILYALMSILVYNILHMKFIKPLGINAPIDRFSEGRAMEHLRVLSKDIGDRQEGRPGLRQAADYIRGQLELLKNQADSNFRIDVEESMVNGSFNMMFLGHSISSGYRALTNVLLRISSVNSTEQEASVLVNAHFDSALNSPGAGDCGSCVASMLELARVVVDSGWIPPRPIIFLFNGAEELYMLGSHGFMTTHRWRDSIGAFINLEASGSGGPDLVCQSGPGSWPSLVYAQSAVYPMAQSSAQDVFGVVSGDTDYRMFAQDYGKIPGLDIIFLLGGYYYHTSYDTLERILPGSIQARGDNLLSLVKAFASSSMLRNASERQHFESANHGTSDERAVFFDYMMWFMVYFPRHVVAVLHILPILMFLAFPFISLANRGLRSCCKTYFDILKGLLQHIVAIMMGIIVPLFFAVLRLFFSRHAMNWFANPYLAYMMFVPCSVVGLLIPRYVWRCFHLFQDMSVQKVSRETRTEEADFVGTFGYYAMLTMICFLAGLGGGYLTLFVSASMLLAWICIRLLSCHEHSLRLVVLYTFLLLPCLTYAVHFSAFLMQFLIERMGMMGSIPPPFGYYIQDIIVAAMVGAITGWCLGPMLPVVGDLLARSSVIQVLLQLCVLALGVSSVFFPYSVDAPKRVALQHTVLTADSMQILDSSYELGVVDSNSLSFVFKHASEVSEHLQIDSGCSFETTKNKWLAIFPVTLLFSESLKIPVKREEILKEYKSFPYLSIVDREEFSDTGIRKVHLQLDLGSLKEVWVTVLNITGPLSGWSFADETLPAPETLEGGSPSYISRLSGASNEKWAFWLEANSSKPIKVEVASLDQHLTDGANNLKERFPDWIDVIAYTSFMSSYSF